MLYFCGMLRWGLKRNVLHCLLFWAMGMLVFEVAAQSGAGNRRSLSRSDAPVSAVSGRDARGDASPSEALTEEEEKALLKKRREAEKARLKAYKERLERPINGYVFEPDSLLAQPDSMSLLRFTRGVHFADSLKYGLSDSIQAQWAGVDHGKTVVYNYRDPFDPYGNPIYFRRGQGKFWYFGLGMILLLVFMYFRAAYPKQFELRVRGIFNPYYYNELMNDRTITQFGGGSGVVFVFTQAVFAAGVILNLIFGGYLQLNNLWVFVLVYLGVLFAVMLQQTIQFLFGNSVDIEDLIRRQVQRQYNVNFVLSLIFFPLFLVFYYNGYKYHHLNLSNWISFALVLWVVIRSIYALVGLFQDRQLNFLAFLYFCALEILPYWVLFAILSRS
jgi:hypothetical protein